jgi:2-methylisocitrate lyase-like PEP mutase family enzyme
MSQAERAERFLTAHQPGRPLLLPNPWDAGSAKLLASLGLQALATTSSGHAATLGRLDGQVSRDAAIEHARVVVQATELPVSADLENGFEAEPAGMAETVALALEAGLAGCSVEDFSGDDDDPIYEIGLATERIRTAAEVAHTGPVRLVLTARAEITSTAVTTWTTRSPGCRPTRRPEPMSSTPPGWSGPRTSAAWSARWSGR